MENLFELLIFILMLVPFVWFIKLIGMQIQKEFDLIKEVTENDSVD